MQTRRVRWYLLAGIALVTLVAACGGAPEEKSDDPKASSPPSAVLAEKGVLTPDQWRGMRGTHQGFVLDDSLQAIMRPTPERHDEQSFRSRCSSPGTCPVTYGPHARIFAVEGASSGQWPTGEERAVAQVQLEPGSTWPALGLTGSSGRPEDMNLVYIKRTGQMTFTGRVVATNQQETVVRVRAYGTGITSTADPASWAAFDDDTQTGETYLGVRCGDRLWCVIVPESVTGSMRPRSQASCPSSEATWKCAGGWADRQLLATRGSSGLVLSGAVGTIVPVQYLDAIDNPVSPTRVATIYVTGTDYTKGGMTFYNGGKATLEIRVTNPNAAEPNRTFEAIVRSYRNGESNPAVTRTYTTDRTNHSGSVPGTARWQWSDNDEGIWIRCGLGCCKITL